MMRAVWITILQLLQQYDVLWCRDERNIEDEVSVRLSPSQVQKSPTSGERCGTPMPTSPVNKQNIQEEPEDLSTGIFKAPHLTVRKRGAQLISISSDEEVAEEQGVEIIEDPPVFKKKAARGPRSIYIRWGKSISETFNEGTI